MLNRICTALARLIARRLRRPRALVVRAWFWLAASTDDLNEKRRYFEAILRLEPLNWSARYELLWIKHQQEDASIRNAGIWRKTTVEQAEAAYMFPGDRRLGSRLVPFGPSHDEWKALLAQMVDGDELWEFWSPEMSWKALAGRAGFALVRNGKIIDWIYTLIS
jgi:hypothetical protein